MKICPRCHSKYEDSATVCSHDGLKLESMPEQNTKLFDELVGKVLAGRFKILSKLGQGGMGAVYKAEQLRMNRICAVKVIPPELAKDREAIERFDREAKMAALINDQHAVTVYDFGETEDGMYFLAMEYVEGETLSRILRREGLLPLSRVIPIVQQASQALHAAHSQSIVHRDLKPDNIMIAKKEGRDYVKILDFGIAKFLADDRGNNITRTGFVVGTPLYMSPEQLSGDPVDPSSDVYSFALIVYQMLTGGFPFSGDSAQALMIRRLTEDPLPIKAVNPNVDIPANVEAVLLTALARDRKHRTASIKVFAEQFIQAANLARGGASLAPITSADAGTLRSHPGVSTPSGRQGALGSATVPTSNQPLQPPVQQIPQRVSTPPSQLPIVPAGPVVSPPLQGAPGLITPQGFAQMPPQQGIMPTPALPPGAVPAGLPRPSIPAPPVAQKKSSVGLWILGIFGFIALAAIAVIVVVILIVAGGSTGSSPQTKAGETGEVATDNPPVGGGAEEVKQSTAFEHYNKGVHYLDAGDYRAAADEFRAAITLKPDYPEAQENLAVSLYYARDYEEAVKEARQAVKVYGGNRASTYDLLGRALYDSRQYLKAAESFKRALELEPNDTTAVLVGFAMDMAGRHEEAKQVYMYFLEKFPNSGLVPVVEKILDGEQTPPVELPKDR
ncbi:MAG: protein kinase [Acidobacteriota bacterium]|nr:protein kinase [Blastocatellia bacterium]MDW8411599.1 protein kinase [Acidobacteriota bacterium]